MALPTLLPGWEQTRDTLHRATTVLGVIRAEAIDPLPYELQYSVLPLPRGCSTGALGFGGALTLDFAAGKITFVEGGVQGFTLALAGHDQRSLCEALLERLAAAGKLVEPSTEKLSSREPFELDPSIAADAATVYAKVWNALAGFRARLSGYMTPLVLWPHHFDLSFLWFPGPGTDEKKDRQMNFGFAPFSEGFPAPYLYSYAWPLLEAAASPELRASTRWHSEGWTGAVVDYGDFANATEPEQVIEDAMMDIFQALRPLLSQEEKR